jgi:hypothetical protein
MVSQISILASRVLAINYISQLFIIRRVSQNLAQYYGFMGGKLSYSLYLILALSAETL